MLIPKTSKPNNMKNFHPIRLCSVLHKIISKTVANHFQKVLSCCIDEAQSAFIPKRLIIDNILLAYEILEVFKWKRIGMKGYFPLKLDMSKTYNGVEWEFLRKMLLKMGFVERWVGFIHNCVSSVTYSVILNGEVSQRFSPRRGLRERDLLSPYLFLI